MFLLSLLHLRIPSRILFRMVVRFTASTVEGTPRRSGRTRAIVNYARQVAIQEPEGPTDLGAESPLTDLESEETTEPLPKNKRRSRAKIVEPVVYNIPPVEIKTTTFKGTDVVSICALSRTYKQLFRSFGIRTLYNV